MAATTGVANHPKVVVINLDSRSDRLLEITTELRRLGCPWERLAASRPNDLQWSPIESTPAEAACTLSHVRAYESITRSGAPWGLILEDDAVLGPRFLARAEEGVAGLPPDWLVLQLGVIDYSTLRSKGWKRCGRIVLAPFFRRLNWTRPCSFTDGTHAYAVSAMFAKEFASMIDGRHLAIDQELNRLSQPGGPLDGGCFAHNPNLSFQRRSPSDVRDGRAHRSYPKWRRWLF